MIFRAEKNIWTYLIVTAVTVVIWFLAASETRESDRLNAMVHVHVSDTASQWIVSPTAQSIRITVEGSNPAIERAREVAQRGIVIALPPIRGSDRISLLEHVRRSGEIATTGVAVVSVEPAILEVERDEVVAVSARVRSSLPGVQTEGEVTIDPPEVTISMPSALRDRIVGEVTVEAFLDRAQLERLAPDVRHEQDAKIRLGEAIAGLATLAGASSAHVAVSPGTVKLGFTIRSRTRQTTLDLVRVRLSGPPEDNEEYIVDFEDEVIRNITVTGDAELIRRIEGGESRVFAVVDLDSREKELRIPSKRVSYFVALVPDGENGTRGVLVDGRVGDSPVLPEIRLTIRRKDAP